MAPSPRRIELDEAVTRPGTYYHPSTQMILVVDDGASLDTELFEDEGEENEWVLVADEVPVDETARDEAIERFEARYHPGATGAIAADDDDVDELDDIEPDPDPDGFDDPSGDDEDEDY